MVDKRIVDLTSDLEKECLWFCFSYLLQNILDEIKENWNTHRIRGSRHDTVKGRPDVPSRTSWGYWSVPVHAHN